MADFPDHDLDDEIAVSRWAFALSTGERARLLLATASVMAAEDLRPRPRAVALLDALLPALARDAPAEARRELAHRLSKAPWAPERLLLDLAYDPELELRPLLARAPGLSAAALEQLADEGRPDILQALAERPDLPPSALDTLVQAAVRQPELRDPLARNPGLTPDIAARLHAILGPDLGPLVAGRFALPAPGARPTAAEAEVRLIDKLDRAGRLTPSYAVGALRRGRPGVFGQAVARLADLAPEAVSEALRDEAPGNLALICAAARVDRAAFPTVLSEARALCGLPRDGAPLSPEIQAAFDRTPDEAARALRALSGRRSARWTPPKTGPEVAV